MKKYLIILTGIMCLSAVSVIDNYTLFSSNTEPTNTTDSKWWFDRTSPVIKYHNGTSWIDYTGTGDNLGNGIATTNVDLEGNDLVDVGLLDLRTTANGSISWQLSKIADDLTFATVGKIYNLKKDGANAENDILTMPTLGSTGQVLALNASNKLEFQTVSGSSSREYGFFYNSTNQSIVQNNDLAWNTSVKSSGITIAGNVITLPANTGVYEVSVRYKIDDRTPSTSLAAFRIVDASNTPWPFSLGSEVYANASSADTNSNNESIAFIDTSSGAQSFKIRCTFLSGSVTVQPMTRMTIKRVN